MIKQNAPAIQLRALLESTKIPPRLAWLVELMTQLGKSPVAKTWQHAPMPCAAQE
jgi:hypothetical protein